MSRLRSHVVVAVAVIVSVLLTACGRGGPADPSEAVADASRRTFSQPFSFRVGLDTDEQSRSWMPSQAGVLLSTANIRGRKGEQGHEWALEVLGVRVIEQRQVGRTSYVRVDVPTIASAAGGEFDPDSLRQELAIGDQDPKVAALIDQVLSGGWVGFEFAPQEGPLLPFGLTLQAGDIGAKLKERLGPTLEEFLARFVIVTEIPSPDDGRRFDLDLKARDIARVVMDLVSEMAGSFGAPPPEAEEFEQDLAEVPERVPGVHVEVADRLVRKVEIDLTEMARSVHAGTPEGRLALIADFAGTDDFPLVAPEGALVVTQDELRSMMGTMACPMCTADPEDGLGPPAAA